MIEEVALKTTRILAAVFVSLAVPLSALAEAPSEFLPPQPGAFLRLAAQAEVPPVEGRAAPESVQPQTADYVLPNRVILFEQARRLGTLGTKLMVQDDQGMNLGSLKTNYIDVRRRISETLGFVPRMTIELYSPDEDSVVARAQADLVSYTYTVHVKDGEGRLLGTFKSDLMMELANSYSKIGKGEMSDYTSFYGVYDAQDKLVARSIKSQDYTGIIIVVQQALYDERGGLTGFDTTRPVASIASATGWNIQILRPDLVQAGQPGKVDPRVLLMIPAYKTFVSKENLK